MSSYSAHWRKAETTGALSRTTGTPGLAAEALGAVDGVLLSHHQHGDNLFREGPGELRQAFAAAGLADRLRVPEAGRAMALGVGGRASICCGRAGHGISFTLTRSGGARWPDSSSSLPFP
jgi:hypothetical protein